MHPARLAPEDILYRDEDLLAVNKPAGVPVHGGRILEGRPETLLSMVREQCGTVVHAPHRLDRPVSGAMVMTGKRSVLAELGLEFEHRRVAKCYLAVLRGWTDERGTISHALRPARDERKVSSKARPAITRYERIAQVELPVPVEPYPTSRYSLVALYPETGRRHQLRRHMKHISHHLVGDSSYGRGEHNRLFRERFGCHRLLLHAWSLKLQHPVSREWLTVHAPLDRPFDSVINGLGWAAALEAWAVSVPR